VDEREHRWVVELVDWMKQKDGPSLMSRSTTFMSPTKRRFHLEGRSFLIRPPQFVVFAVGIRNCVADERRLTDGLHDVDGLLRPVIQMKSPVCSQFSV
jgi:hypothetical protein